MSTFGFDLGSAISNTASIDQLFELSKPIKALSLAIFGFSKTADQLGKDVRGSKAANKAINTGKVDLASDKAGLKLQDEIISKLESIVDKLDKFQIKDGKISLLSSILLTDEQLENGDKIIDFLTRLEDFASKKASSFAKSLGLIVDALTSAATKAATHKDEFESLNEMFASLSNAASSISSVSKSLMQLALGIVVFAGSIILLTKIAGAGGILVAVTGMLVIGAAIYALSKLNTSPENDSILKGLGKDLALMSLGVIALAIGGLIFNSVGLPGFLMMISSLALLALTVALANKIASPDSDTTLAQSILALSAGTILLALSGVIFGQVGLPGFLMMIGALAMLGLTLALISKLGGKRKSDPSTLLVQLAVGLMVFTLAVWLWNKLIPDPTDAIAPMIAIGALAGILALVGSRANDMFKAALAIAISSIALIILAFVIKQFDGISKEAYIGAGLSLLGITGALIALGSVGNSLLGAISLLVGSIALILISTALKMTSNVDPATMLSFGAFVLGFSGVLIGLGFVPMAMLGAVTLIVGSVALLLLAAALKTAKGSEDVALPMAAGILAIGGAFAILGNPFTLLFLLSGVAAGIAMGSAMLLIAKSFSEFKKANVSSSDIESISSSMSVFIDSMFNVFDRNALKMLKVRLGIFALAGLGSLLTDVAYGMQSMSKLEFVEHEVRNGKLVPVRARKLTNADFLAVGRNIDTIINAVHEPLAKIGEQTQGSWLFSKNPVADGIKAVSGLGTLMTTLASGVSDMANLRFTEYGVKNGQLVPLSVRTLTEQDFANVGTNFDKIINAISGPLAKIGASAGVFTDSDVKNGIDELSGIGEVITPLVELVKTFADLESMDSGKGAGQMVSDVLESLSAGLERSSKLTFSTSPFMKIGAVMMVVNKQANEFQGVVDTFGNFADNLERINDQLSQEKFKKIMEVKKAIEDLTSGELSEKFERLLELVAERMTKALEAIADASNRPNVTSSTNTSINENNVQTQDAKAIVAQQQSTAQEMDSILATLSDIHAKLSGTLSVSVQNNTY